MNIKFGCRRSPAWHHVLPGRQRQQLPQTTPICLDRCLPGECAPLVCPKTAHQAGATRAREAAPEVNTVTGTSVHRPLSDLQRGACAAFALGLGHQQ